MAGLGWAARSSAAGVQAGGEIVALNSGAMATPGGLVSHANPDGNFQAHDAADGDLLWQYQLGFVGPSGGLRVNGGGPVNYEYLL
jgi:glucose dehydrogenase